MKLCHCGILKIALPFEPDNKSSSFGSVLPCFVTLEVTTFPRDLVSPSEMKEGGAKDIMDLFELWTVSILDLTWSGIANAQDSRRSLPEIQPRCDDWYCSIPPKERSCCGVGTYLEVISVTGA